MKFKNLFTYFGLATLITTSFILISCQKEQTGIDKQETQTEKSLKDTQLEKRIVAFRDKIDLIRENPTLKSSTEPMDVDSAVWYIEATSNFTFGDASFKTEEFIVDSAFIEVPVTNGQILLADVQAAYDQVVNSLAEHNANITANQKQLVVADISLKESDVNFATFEVTSGFGTDGTTGFGNNYPWYWGWELGRCDGSGLGVGKDAADKIAYLANMEIPVPVGHSYYTDVTEIEVWYWDVPTNNNPYGEYLLFHDFQEFTLNHHCLSTAEISYYKNALGNIANMYKPSGKSLIKYYCWDETSFMICGGDDCWDMCHVGRFKYGIWHKNNTPPFEL
jgi:hypothetical protein